MSASSNAPARAAVRMLALVFAGFLAAAPSWAQDGAAAGPPPAATPAAPGGLEPVFPREIESLVFVEGEDAVSTNMAAEATQNYGCSGNRALQLVRGGPLPGDRPFYAEYVVRTERAGSFELWYGGTPPGPADEFSLSLASPVSVVVDDQAPRRLHREDVNVVEQYAPAYYWIRGAKLDLAEGNHVIRFEISEKRRLDERWFFYLDAFFLAQADALAAIGAEGRGLAEGAAPSPGAPDRRLPLDPASRAIDKPFRSIEDYQAYVQASPASLAAYLELSAIHSLSGDYLSALKVLSRAATIAPDDPQVKLLIAKNRIWRGDVKEGLDAYKAYLQLRPADLSAYAEAAKVAAWTGRYPESKAFYAAGLAAFPGELSLLVNLGLTQLWSSESREAERSFAQAEGIALADGAASLRLASIYRTNGYPDKAIAFYEKAIAVYPELLALYLGESEIYAERGDAARAEAVQARIVSVFAPSPRLSAFLAAFAARRDLKADRIRALETAVAERPGDLALREDLTRVYFWNGFKEKAVLQLESILAALFAAELDESDAAAPELAATLAAASALRADSGQRLASLGKLSTEAEARAKAAVAARSAWEEWERRRAAAEAALAEIASAEPSASEPSPTTSSPATASEASGPAPAPATVGAAKGKSKNQPKMPDPAEGEALAAARDAAASAFADAVQAFAAEEARAAALVERARALRDAFAPAADREQGLEEGFRKVAESSGWEWDAAAAAAELAGPAGRGEGLAAYARARAIATSGDAKAALAALTGGGEPAVPSLAERRRETEYLIRLRSDYREARDLASRAAATGTLPTGSSLEAAAGELAVVESAGGGASSDAGGPEAALAAAQADLAELKRSVASAQADLAILAQSASVLSDKRVARAWYSFEEKSAYRRAELGAYYDGLGLAAKAAAQYRRVLAVDPGNLPATYNLALAEDRAGDWRSASRHLRSVYSADPDYGSAASVYNRIARSRAPTFDVDSTWSADSNRLASKAGAALRLPLTSDLSLGLSVGLDSVRDVAAALPAFIAGRVGVEAPFAIGLFGTGNVVFRPQVALIGTSADYVSAGGATSAPEDFLQSLNLFTAGGLALDFRAGTLSGTASYRWEPLADTLNPARFPLYAHRGELSAGAYLPLQGAFRYFAPRFYGIANYIPADGNFFGTALLEAIPAFKLSDSPWSNLGLPLDLVYEGSEIARTTPYYAADQALTAKGGLLWQSVFTKGGGEALSANLQAMGGLYQTKTFEPEPERNLYLQLLGRLEWVGESATYWLSCEATGAGRFDTETIAYWSFSLLGGATTKQPRLIAP